MRATRPCRALATATVTLAAMGLAVGPASAVNGDVEFFPNPARPGNGVAVNTTFCSGDDSATGNASALGAGTFSLGPSTLEEVLVGQFTVPSDAAVGSYDVTVACATGGRVTTGTLRVVEASATTSPTATATATRTVTSTPTGTVSGGFGGSDDGSTAVIAGISAVILAATAAGVWVVRRRSGAGQHF